MDKSIIAIPLLDQIEEEEDERDEALHQGKDAGPPKVFPVIIDLNLEFNQGRSQARERVKALVQIVASEGRMARLVREADVPGADAPSPRAASPQYVFAEMDGQAIRRLAELDNPGSERPPGSSPVQLESAMRRAVDTRDPQSPRRAIYRIWPDFEVRTLIVKSLSTVKADAARSAFAALGTDMVWAVVDSGIDGTHGHFALHRNLEVAAPLGHFDYTGSAGGALTDEAGHGTHVAGIIAGEIELELEAPSNEALPGLPSPPTPSPMVKAYGVTRHWDEKGGVTFNVLDLPKISGMAPRCKLVSFKVLDKDGKGRTSSILDALEQIQELNGYGRRLLIHGVNLSVGYDFQPEWFACGQSPLCIEVDRLVRSGVFVVVAAGNTGYGFQSTRFRGTVATGMPLSINDPGNAALAITVGSTHRDMPHTYGVSYFSSKGPTGDGRLKPEVVAPGEKVLSCAAGPNKDKASQSVASRPGTDPAKPLYYEESGTSMAAPHVSGIVAAFLSIRREFIGRPEEVKRIFTATATDLNRDKYFQGYGLVDLMRAIQSV